MGMDGNKKKKGKNRVLSREEDDEREEGSEGEEDAEGDEDFGAKNSIWSLVKSLKVN